MSDAFDLDRFVRAQDPVYQRVREELKAGRKQSHWMWFIFPQISGLGMSEMSRRYAIASLEEARAYLAHPVLGPRLREVTGLVNAVSGRTAHEIFSSPDDQKFRSAMTLFARAATDNAVFTEALRKYFSSAEDPRTLALL